MMVAPAQLPLLNEDSVAVGKPEHLSTVAIFSACKQFQNFQKLNLIFKEREKFLSFFTFLSHFIYIFFLIYIRSGYFRPDFQASVSGFSLCTPGYSELYKILIVSPLFLCFRPSEVHPPGTSLIVIPQNHLFSDSAL